jgi:hypothetical protein
MKTIIASNKRLSLFQVSSNRRTGQLGHSSAADNEVIIGRSCVAETKLNLLHEFFYAGATLSDNAENKLANNLSSA